MITCDDIYESGGIIVECMEEDLDEGIKQLHSAIRLQELVKNSIKRYEKELNDIDIGYEDELHAGIKSTCLNSLVEESEK